MGVLLLISVVHNPDQLNKTEREGSTAHAATPQVIHPGDSPFLLSTQGLYMCVLLENVSLFLAF